MDYLKSVEKIRNGEYISKSELDSLYGWLVSQEGERQVEDEVHQLLIDFKSDQHFDSGDLLGQIIRKHHQQKHLQKRKISHGRRWIAAAVLIPTFIAFGIWMATDRNAVDNNMIVRISDEVILTLPDGSQVALDQSTDNSVITQQDNIALIHEHGRLISQKQEGDTGAPAELSWGTIAIPKGSQFDMVLEDGTEVWLNAGSKLRFPTAFAKGERLVYLEGEGYFKVTPDKDKPFIVETAEQTLTVFGTEFNIYAYPGEPKVLTTLVSGSVGVTAKDSDEQKILVPGQQLQLDNATKLFAVSTVNADKVTFWRNKMFIFDGDTLGQVFAKLARWYDMQYEFEGTGTEDLILRGSVPVYDDISKVLELIESSDRVVIKQKDNLITIKMKK